MWLAEDFPALPDEWLDDCLQKDVIDAELQASLLRGQPDEAFLNGKLVCSCFNVREKSIEVAIAEGACSVEALGEKLKCGTNCGSCKPELKQILQRQPVLTAAVAHTEEVVTYD